MTIFLAQRLPTGAETIYNPGQTAVDSNTPFNPIIALMLFLVAGALLAFLLNSKQR